MKGKLAEPKFLHRSFIFWHWRVVECLGQTWKQLSKSAHRKIGQFVSNCRKGYKFHIWFALFVWKVSWLNQKTSAGVWFCDTIGPCKRWGKTECCFPNQPPQNWAISFECLNRVQISNFIGFYVWNLSSLKESFSQQFYLITLKGCGMCWPKLKAPFEMSPPKIGKFL